MNIFSLGIRNARAKDVVIMPPTVTVEGTDCYHFIILSHIRSHESSATTGVKSEYNILIIIIFHTL